MEASIQSQHLCFILQGENLILWMNGSGGLCRSLLKGAVVEDFFG